MSKRELKREKKAKSPAPAEEPDEGEQGKGRKVSSRLALVLIALAAVAFLVYSLVTLIGIRSQLRDRRQELTEIQDQITVQEIKNDEMNKTYSLSDSERSDYIEQIARDDLDYVREGERVFVNVSGD